MQNVEKANEIIEQILMLVNVSLTDIITGAFVRVVTFLVNLLLGL